MNMKNTVAAVLALTAVTSFGGGVGVSYSTTSTAPNKWTMNLKGVLKAAPSTQYPILLVWVGESCSHCDDFMRQTIYGSRFPGLVASYNFYMVYVNDGVYHEDIAPDSYFWKYATSENYPLVCILRPNGGRYMVWGRDTTDYRDACVSWVNRGTPVKGIEECLKAFPYAHKVSPTKLSFSEGSRTIAVDRDSAGAYSYQGRVNRTGSAGTTGTLSLSLSGAASGKYALSSGSLEWDDTDSPREFTVTEIDPGARGGVVCDSLVVSMAGTTGFGSVAELGTRKINLMFKDGRVDKSLPEFSAGYASQLAMESDSTWYVPTSGSGALVADAIAAGGASVLQLTAKTSGMLSLSALLPDGRPGCSVAVSRNGGDAVALADADSSFPAAPGDVFTVTAAADDAALEPGEIGLKGLEFTALAPTTAYLKCGVLIDLGKTGGSDFSCKNLPSGLSLDAKTGVVSGSAKKTGKMSFTVKAKDSNGNDVSYLLEFNVEKFPAELKSKYYGVLFDSDQKVAGSVSYSVNASGAASVQSVVNGVKSKTKAQIVVTADRIYLADASLKTVQLQEWGQGVWYGRCRGYDAAVCKFNAGSSSSESYTAGIIGGAGYAVITVKGGKCSVKGKIRGKVSYSAKDMVVSLPKAFVSDKLDQWDASEDSSFFCINGKKAGSGGGQLMKSGGVIGWMAGYELVGQKWNASQNLSVYGGRNVLIDGSSISFALSYTSAKKLVPAANGFAAKFSANQKTGVFKGQAKDSSGVWKFEGVLVDGLGYGGTSSPAARDVQISDK